MSAASALFLDGGLKALSVRAIAAKAGVSTIGIYSHFQGKQGVLDALYIEGFAQVEAALVADERAAPREAARETVRRYLDTAERFEAHYWLIFGEDSVEYEPSTEAQAAAGRAFGRLCKLADRLLRPRPSDGTESRAPTSRERAEAERAALQIWALTHGFVSLRRNAIAREIAPERWEPMILEAVDRQIAAILEERDPGGGGHP
ncbi:MAG: TetR family transcriptional regulator [Pseudomonadota bacterium]